MNLETISSEKFAFTTDLLIFSISNGEKSDVRKLPEKKFSILLVKRDKEPYINKWCLPGGFVGINETLNMAADRVLQKETNLKNIYKEQLYTFDDISRDPRKRVISATYMALIDKNKIKDELSKESKWFDITLKETAKQIDVILKSKTEEVKFAVKKNIKETTTKEYEYEILENENIGFDHPIILVTAILRMRNKAKDTDIVFNMLPKYFTLGELQQVFEIVLNKKLLDPAFRRIIADRVEKTDKVVKTGGHRPSNLYKYKY